MAIEKIIQAAIDNNPLKLKEAFEDEMNGRLRSALQEAVSNMNEDDRFGDTDKVTIEYKGNDERRKEEAERYGIKIGAPRQRDGKSIVTGDHDKVAKYLAKHYGSEEKAKEKHPRVFKSDDDSGDSEFKPVAIQVGGSGNLQKIFDAMNEQGEVGLDEMLGFEGGGDADVRGETVFYPDSEVDENGLKEIIKKCDYRTKLSNYTAKRIAAHINNGGKVNSWEPSEDDTQNIGYDALYYNGLLENVIKPSGSGFTYRAKLS